MTKKSLEKNKKTGSFEFKIKNNENILIFGLHSLFFMVLYQPLQIKAQVF